MMLQCKRIFRRVVRKLFSYFSEFLVPVTIFCLLYAGITTNRKHIEQDAEEQTYQNLGGKIPSSFLPDYKSPCWHDKLGENITTKLKCLPYFYLIGAPKCGTTELHTKLVAHPLISKKVVKEPHWINRQRYVFGRELSYYLHIFNTAVKEDIVYTEKENGYHPVIFGDCSASTLWDIRLMLKENKYLGFTEPPSTNADTIKQLNPFAKIIVILRNPTQRLYSDFLFFGKGESANQFHYSVLDAIKNFTTCLTNYSLRHCAYLDLPKMTRLHIGLYHVFIEDFMRVFTWDQMHIMKLEDYSENPVKYLGEVFSFLDLGKSYYTSDLDELDLNKTSRANKRRTNVGGILPETKHILDDFYKPYNERLTALLGQKFNYN